MKFDNLVVLVIFLAVVSFGGLLAGVMFYQMEILETTLMTVDFQIPGAQNGSGEYNVTTFQDILEITAYPILGLRSSLPYLTYFMVFAFIIALGMTAYVTSKNPVFFVVHLLFTLLMTYFCFIIANTYIELLTNPFINSLMINFVIYNKLMLYLPQIVFFSGLIFGIISFVSVMKPQSPDKVNSLQYGGDY